MLFLILFHHSIYNLSLAILSPLINENQLAQITADDTSSTNNRIQVELTQSTQSSLQSTLGKYRTLKLSTFH